MVSAQAASGPGFEPHLHPMEPPPPPRPSDAVELGPQNTISGQNQKNEKNYDFRPQKGVCVFFRQFCAARC